MNQIHPAPTTNGGVHIPPPLRVLQDMPAHWTNFKDATFDEAADRIVTAHKADGESKDLPVMNLSTWGVVPVDGQFAMAPLGKQHGPKMLRANAFSNLMTKLGAPTDFIRDRLPAPLQLATTNWLLASQEKSQSALLRLRGEEITAVVSDRYCPIDNEELLACVRDALVQQNALGDVEVRSIATGLVDVVRLTFPSEQQAMKVGDVTALGLDISSSSFGKSAVHIRGILFRLVCLNGMRVQESAGSFSFRHVGDIDRMRAGIGEAIPSALAVARGTMARWKAAVNVMVNDVAAFIDSLRDLTQLEHKLVEEHVQRELHVPALPEHAPLYELLNGVTSAAQALAPARRIEVEAMAGDLLVRHTSTGSAS